MKEKDKIYEPARLNLQPPAEGMAAVNTHLEEEVEDNEIEEKEEKDKEDEPRNASKK